MENIGNENEQVEFKKSTDELKEGVISIASILNKHGSGELYFAMKNNGDVIGQEISDKTLHEISQEISNHIKLVIYLVIEAKDYDGTADFKTYLAKAKKVGRIEFDSDDPEQLM